MRSLFDTYTLWARIVPGAITLVPAIVLWEAIVASGSVGGYCNTLASVRIVGDLSLFVIVLYAWALLARFVGRGFEDRQFRRANGFPTTYLMLFSHGEFSKEYKRDYRRKVQKVTGINLPDEREEYARPDEARRRLDEVVKQVILYVGDGNLVKKHNTWYGFYRNLIGGALLAGIVSIAMAIVGTYVLLDSQLATAGVVLLAPYLALLLFHRSILTQSGEAYARQLIAEFIAK